MTRPYVAAVFFTLLTGFSFLGIKECQNYANQLSILIYRYDFAFIAAAAIWVFGMFKSNIKRQTNIISIFLFFICISSFNLTTKYLLFVCPFQNFFINFTLLIYYISITYFFFKNSISHYNKVSFFHLTKFSFPYTIKGVIWGCFYQILYITRKDGLFIWKIYYTLDWMLAQQQ